MVTFFQDFMQVFSLALSEPEAQYVLLVPFVAAYFFYRRRKAFLLPRRSSRLQDLTGAATCLLALLVYVWGSYSFYALQLHLIALPIFLAGATLLIFGTDVLKLLAFPIGLLIFLSPFPLIFMDAYGANLMSSDAALAGSMLKLFLPTTITYQPIVVLTSVTTAGKQIQFSLDAACSGIYSLTAFLFCAVVFGYMASGSPIKKISYAAIAVVAAYLLNVFRIAIMVVLGHFFGLGLAVDFFHEIGGTALAFIGALILLYFGSKVVKLSFVHAKTEVCSFCEESKEKICPKCGRILKWPKIEMHWKRMAFVLLFLLVCADLIAQASAVNYNAVMTGTETAVNFNPNTGELGAFSNLTGWSSTFAGRETSAEQQLGLVFVGDYLLSQNNGSGSVNAIFEVSNLQSKFHTWEGCLNYQAYPIKIQKITYETIYDQGSSIVNGETIVANAPTLSQTLTLVYWFDNLNLKTNNSTTSYCIKVTLYNFLTNQNNQTAQAANVQESSNQLLSLSQNLENTWSQDKNSNYTFAVDIYRNSGVFAASVTALLLFCVLALTVKQLRLRTAARGKIAKLPEEDKRLLTTLKKNQSHNLEETTLEKTSNVADKLEHFRQENMLREKISARNDEIYQEWTVY
jgi:exosortase